MLLVADVGGTNTRVALIREQGSVSDLERFENDDFTSFEKVLTRYFEQKEISGLTGCSIAVAGPVTSGSATLTNRGWHFHRQEIATLLSLKSQDSVFLVNDLMALGYALPNLTPTQKENVQQSAQFPLQNNQAIVVGLGTGFNTCVVNSDINRFVVNAAELGHASLPASVYSILQAGLGAEAAQFTTNEHLFSGDGLSRLFRVVSGADEKTGPQILAAFETGQNDAATRTVELFVHALGIAARELVFQYLPYGGINYAGGVARGVLGSSARSGFLAALNAPGPFGEHIAMVPVHVITDDAAALQGAAQFALGKATSA